MTPFQIDPIPLQTRYLESTAACRQGKPYQGREMRRAVADECLRLWLNYKSRSNGDEWQEMKYPVYLSWTPCNYGGQRAWWLCPAVGCRRRVAVLYGGSVYACRHCHRLAYRTQRENAGDRAGSKADKLRDRLGWEAGILNGNGGKPKAMHWQTFDRLEALHDANVNQSLAEVMARFKGLTDLIKGERP